MNANVVLGVVLLPAVMMASLYQPMLTKLSVALVSPYPKADLRKRWFAAAADLMLVASTLVVYANSGNLLYVFAGAVYVLLRDCAWGRSVGKFWSGLVVVSVKDGRPCSRADAVKRNLLFVLPGANVVAVFLEAVTLARDSQGQRLGDRFAGTQVVEGFGAKDAVAAVQRWWLDFLLRLDGEARNRDRTPVRVPR